MKSQSVLAAGVVLIVGSAVFAAKEPPAAEWNQAEKEILGPAGADKDAAVVKVKDWVKGGWVSDHLWRQWIPALVKDDRQQDVADLGLWGYLGRSDPGAAILLQQRAQALLAMKKYDEALAAAKSYYNVCDVRASAGAVNLIATILPLAHPEDSDMGRRFRTEQSQALAGHAPAGDSILEGVKIDATLFDEAIKAGKAKAAIRDRIGYGNLLLAADKGEEAEQLFRELYQVALAGDELTQTTEGIARSLKAQDGNGARAINWLNALPGVGGPAIMTMGATTRPTTTPADPRRP